MKHRKLTIAAIVVAGALATFWAFRLWSSGPSYEGKSAAQWLKLYRTSSIAEREDAIDAFKALGDRAVPYLLSVLTRGGPPLVRTYEKLWPKLPQPLQKVLPRVATEEETESHAANNLLRVIRPSAKVLMPQLKPWLSSPDHPRYLLAIDLLGSVGDGRSQAVPFLVQALQSTNRYHRIFAVQSLRNFGAEALAAVPALIGALDDPGTRTFAIRALGNIGPEAKDALPHLEQFLLKDRYAPAVALHKINSDGKGLSLLIEDAKDPGVRLAAIQHLGELGPAALPAVDVILEALKAEAGRDRVGASESISIADALLRISPTNRAVIPILVEKLGEAERLVRQNKTAGTTGMNAYGYLAASAKSDCLSIASRIVLFDPAEPHGLKALVETLQSDPEPGRRAFAAYALRQAGPGARAAIPGLKAVLNDKNKAVRASAASALKKIEPPSAE